MTDEKKKEIVIIIPIKCSTSKKIESFLPTALFWLLVFGAMMGMFLMVTSITELLTYPRIFAAVMSYVGITIVLAWLFCPYELNFKCRGGD